MAQTAKVLCINVYTASERWHDSNVSVFKCLLYGAEEKCTEEFGGDTWGKQTTWKIQA
jgi:hypothetical protein